MITHILNGDSLANEFANAHISGELVICRECLIEGPVRATSSNDFWAQRAQYLSEFSHDTTNQYHQKVVTEYEKLFRTQSNDEINLWFENDLFCQANMWFTLWYLREQNITCKLFRVFPLKPDDWRGFGPLTADELIRCNANRVQLSANDFELGVELWLAYRVSDFKKLQVLAKTTSNCFQMLSDVVRAHLERFPEQGADGRPEKTLKEILASGTTAFDEIYTAFFKKEGIYGFGDLQVKNMLAKLQ